MNPADQRGDDLAAVPESEVREQLQRILASPLFRNSARLQRFLQLAVERTLAGKLDELKEYALGRDAFDRGAEYDPRTDSIVRVEAQRLRGKLRDYYGSLGRTESVVITLNPGSYVPVFSRVAPLHETRAAEPPPGTCSIRLSRDTARYLRRREPSGVGGSRVATRRVMTTILCT